MSRWCRVSNIRGGDHMHPRRHFELSRSTSDVQSKLVREFIPPIRRPLELDVPPSVLRVSPPSSTRRSTESDGAWSLVDAGTRCAPSEPMVCFVAVEDLGRLRMVAPPRRSTEPRRKVSIKNCSLTRSQAPTRAAWVAGCQTGPIARVGATGPAARQYIICQQWLGPT